MILREVLPPYSGSKSKPNKQQISSKLLDPNWYPRMFTLLCPLETPVTKIGGKGDYRKGLIGLASGTRVYETYAILILKQPKR
jgi:hypothetical protein